MAGTKTRKGSTEKQRNLIIRREEPSDEPAHGGAWKVAYADFVTAMMAFFLVMWLINATTQAQRVGLADYFSQENVLNRGPSGEGKIFGGRTPFDKGELASDSGSIQVRPGRNPAPSGEKRNLATTAERGASSGTVRPGSSGTTDRASDQARNAASQPRSRRQAPEVAPQSASAASGKAVTNSRATASRSRQTAGTGQSDHASTGKGAALKAAANDIRSTIAADPILSQIRSHVSIRQSARMLEIQIIDTKKHPMFTLGSPEPNPATRLLLRRITPILARLDDPIRIQGYTDARPFKTPGKNNWTLSVERANATRTLMVAAGLPSNRISEISGFADNHLLVPDDPLAAANRRIAILVLHEPPDAASNPAKAP